MISDGNISTANHSRNQTNHEPADVYSTSSGKGGTGSDIPINSSQPFIPSTYSRLPTSQVAESDSSILLRPFGSIISKAVGTATSQERTLQNLEDIKHRDPLMPHVPDPVTHHRTSKKHPSTSDRTLSHTAPDKSRISTATSQTRQWLTSPTLPSSTTELEGIHDSTYEFTGPGSVSEASFPSAALQSDYKHFVESVTTELSPNPPLLPTVIIGKTFSRKIQKEAASIATLPSTIENRAPNMLTSGSPHPRLVTLSSILRNKVVHSVTSPLALQKGLSRVTTPSTPQSETLSTGTSTSIIEEFSGLTSAPTLEHTETFTEHMPTESQRTYGTSIDVYQGTHLELSTDIKHLTKPKLEWPDVAARTLESHQSTTPTVPIPGFKSQPFLNPALEAQPFTTPTVESQQSMTSPFKLHHLPTQALESYPKPIKLAVDSQPLNTSLLESPQSTTPASELQSSTSPTFESHPHLTTTAIKSEQLRDHTPESFYYHTKSTLESQLKAPILELHNITAPALESHTLSRVPASESLTSSRVPALESSHIKSPTLDSHLISEPTSASQPRLAELYEMRRTGSSTPDSRMDSRTSKQSDQQKQLEMNESYIYQNGDQPEVITMVHSDDNREADNKKPKVHSDDITKNHNKQGKQSNKTGSQSKTSTEDRAEENIGGKKTAYDVNKNRSTPEEGVGIPNATSQIETDGFVSIHTIHIFVGLLIGTVIVAFLITIVNWMKGNARLKQFQVSPACRCVVTQNSDFLMSSLK